jgi:hypothetical protein
MNVLITGAAGGLGRAFVNECAKRRYAICAIDINEAGLTRIQQGVKQRFDVEILTYRCDILSQTDVDAMLESLSERQFEIDILINVAGIDHEGSFLERDFDSIRQIIELNILGTLRLTHRVLRIKREGKALHVINVASMAAEQPIPLKATYAASKRFLLDFSRALREEVKDQHVHVLALCPAGLATNEHVMKAIAGQGYFGALTTVKMERMVTKCIDKSLQGKAKYVPRVLNQIVVFLTKFLPIGFITKLLYKRWRKAQATWLQVR